MLVAFSTFTRSNRLSTPRKLTQGINMQDILKLKVVPRSQHFIC